MYAFERFTERAKKTLTLAQEEAERSHHSYIGTEHLLLGLLRETDGDAAYVLQELQIDIGRVRETIASVLGRNERILMRQIVPTTRVKMVIEIAFDEARRMGHDQVDTGHLLMALVLEGEGIAAHVLEDLGAPAEKVVAALEKRWGAEPSGRGKRKTRRSVRFPGSVRMRLAEMRTVAGYRQPKPPRSEAEALLDLLAVPQVSALLRAHGLDVMRLAKGLAKPPVEVSGLRGQLSAARAELADALGQTDYERAARLQKRIDTLVAKLGRAEAIWFKSLGA